MKPTLLQVATSSWGGGLEVIVRNLAREASERGWRSVVVHWRGPSLSEPGVDYYRLPLGRFVRRWPIELARFVRELRPDVIHLHGPSAGSIGALALSMTGVRQYMYTDHFVHRDRPRHIRTVRFLCARLPTMNVAVSEEVAESLVRDARVSREKVVTVRNGVAVADPAKPPADDEAPRFLFVANLWPRKGHAYLLEAVARLPVPVTVSLVGDGPERVAIEAIIEELAIADRVCLTGFREDPWHDADGAYAYLHPALGEGIGLAVMEAMMRGLPVIGTTVGGIPELVIPGLTGLLVPPRKVESLAAAIMRLIDDRHERDRLAKAARSLALEQFSVRECIDDYFALYEQLR